MNKYGLYIKWIVLLILSLVSVAIFADAPVVQTALKTLSFTPPSTDISVTFLGKLFGNMPGVPQFANKNITIIGTVFSVFNAGVLALSGVFLIYTIFKVVTETTMDGTSIAKAATMWTAVRVGLSTSLLIPQTTGYSLLNGIVMWVVIQSIGLADFTWNRALDYLGSGGVTYTVPTNAPDYSLIDTSIVTNSELINNINSDPTVIGSADVLRALVCTRIVKDALNYKQDSMLRAARSKLAELQTQSRIQPNTLQINTQNDCIYNLQQTVDFNYYKNLTDKKFFQFPFVTQDLNTMYKSCLPTGTTFPNLNGICGYISYNIDSTNPDTIKRYVTPKQQGLTDMITNLSPIADTVTSKSIDPQNQELNPDTYVLYIKSDGTTITKVGFFVPPIVSGAAKYDLNNLNFRVIGQLNPLPAMNWPLAASDILAAAISYQSNLTGPMTIIAPKTVSQEIATDIKNARTIGWIGAGGYYYLLRDLFNIVSKEYTYYRLRVSDAGARNIDPNTIRIYRQYYGSFIQAGDGSPVDKALTFLHPDSRGFLEKAFTWIFLTTPYAKLYGVSIEPEATPDDINNNAYLKGSQIDFMKTISQLAEATDFAEKAAYGVIATGIVLIALNYAPGTALGSILSIGILATVPPTFLAVDMVRVITSWYQNMIADVNTDPVVKLQKLGNDMVVQSLRYLYQMYFFFTATTLSFVTAAAAAATAVWASSPGTFMGATVGIQNALEASIHTGSQLQALTQAIIYMNVPMGLAIVGPLFVSGLTMALYIPLLPYLLFLFGIISWIISVLVLTAAAPIICFLMLWGAASQENPLLSREAETFLMQIIGVFFRPTLMVIGLIVGIQLAYIGIQVLNIGFANIFINIQGVTGMSADTVITATKIPGLNVTVLVLVKYLGFMVIYTFTMVSVVTVCFSPIHLLYSEVMRVIGIQAPAVGMEKEAAHEVKADSKEAAQAGISSLKDSGVGMPKGGYQGFAAKKGEEEKSATVSSEEKK